VDVLALAAPEGISTAARILGRAPEIDLIVYHLGFHPITRWGYGRFASAEFRESMTASLLELQEATGRPVVLALRPPLEVNALSEFLAAQESFVTAGLPVFHSLRDAAQAMSRVVTWSRARERS
jgi:acyl-CoA synthetase (NDP forming)